MVARPASGFRERAPASSLETNGKVTGCGDRYEVEGVRFRLVPWVPSAPAGQDGLVDLLDAAANDAANANLSLLRNWIAHRFLGSEDGDTQLADPFTQVGPQVLPGQGGVLSDLYQGGQIEDCDLPLALVYWPAGGIRYLDPWPVRRAPASDAPAPDVPDARVSGTQEPRWATWLGAGTAAAGRARLAQFQEQLDWLLARHTGTGAADVRARRDFRFLPPLALLPVHPATLQLPAGAGARGIDPAFFFNDIPTVLVRAIDGALLPALVAQSLRLPAVDLTRGELIQVFQTTQNANAVAAGSASPCYVAVAATLMLDLTGRYDAGRFNQTDFA